MNVGWDWTGGSTPTQAIIPKGGPERNVEKPVFGRKKASRAVRKKFSITLTTSGDARYAVFLLGLDPHAEQIRKSVVAAVDHVNPRSNQQLQITGATGLICKYGRVSVAQRTVSSIKRQKPKVLSPGHVVCELTPVIETNDQVVY